MVLMHLMFDDSKSRLQKVNSINFVQQVRIYYCENLFNPRPMLYVFMVSIVFPSGGVDVAIVVIDAYENPFSIINNTLLTFNSFSIGTTLKLQ